MAKVKWIVDPTHSEVGFKVKHLMITNVSGSFSDYDVEVSTEDENFGTARIYAKIRTASINTNNAQRDQHLRNDDFFDVELYPEITFKSDRIESTGVDQFTVHGHLTLKGITKPAAFDVEYNGITTDPWGGTRAGFIITGKIKRNEYDLNFNTVLDSGGLALGEVVRVHSEIQLVRQKDVVKEQSA